MGGGRRGLDARGAVLEDCCEGEGGGDRGKKYEKGFRDVRRGGGRTLKYTLKDRRARFACGTYLVET